MLLMSRQIAAMETVQMWSLDDIRVKADTARVGRTLLYAAFEVFA
jgi:hypothetical protein